MSCDSCLSNDQRTFASEVAIHVETVKDMSKGHVLVFPELRVCMTCGKVVFVLNETELARLVKAAAASA
jgi:hypothetical protein